MLSERRGGKERRAKGREEKEEWNGGQREGWGEEEEWGLASFVEEGLASAPCLLFCSSLFSDSCALRCALA